MTVQSEPLKDGKPVERKQAIGADTVALAIALGFFGALAWIAGGKFTIEGWADWLTRIG